MQLDPSTSADRLWNWRSNVQGAKESLDLKASPTDFSHPTKTDTQAYKFWYRQVQQWNEDNANLPEAQRVPPAAQQDETSACHFVMSTDTTGNAQPYSGTLDNTYWFGDAILIKQYGGTVFIGTDGKRHNANYVSWIRPPTTVPPSAGSWSFTKQNCVSINVVNEVCSCTQPGPPDSCTRQTQPLALRCF